MAKIILNRNRNRNRNRISAAMNVFFGKTETNSLTGLPIALRVYEYERDNGRD